MASVTIILAVSIVLSLIAAIVVSAGWIALLPALALILFAAFLLALKKQRPAPAAAENRPAVPAPGFSPEEIQQRITDEKMAAISKFCSVISHELRNPLASLKNIAYFFSKALKTDDERIKKMVEMMASEIDKTNGMIGNLTEVSHLKRVNKIPSDITALVRGALDSLHLNPNIQVTPQLENVESIADPDKFKKTVCNLVSNAADALPNGGVIDIALKKLESSYELTVKDTGTGMDAETLSHAFDPMFTTKTKTLGLGLTFAREVVRMHGGTIRISSEKDKGTTVTASFLLQAAAPGAGTQPAAPR
jgi:signal transduction histidine kinase